MNHNQIRGALHTALSSGNQNGDILKTQYLFLIRTPYNNLLVNLSVYEFLLAVTGNIIVAFNCFSRHWQFDDSACQIQAIGVTFLGKNVVFI